MKKGKDVIFDGVCSGLAEQFDVDPFWVRLIFVACGLIGIYCLCMFIMEER